MTATIAAPSGDDTDLVAAVRRGDDRAFEVLYQRYHARIAAYVRGMVKDQARAEDVTQEVFFSALRRMRDTERPIAFKPWIYEIARNACIDAYRRNSRADELSYDADDALGAGESLRLVSPDPTPDAAVESKQRLDDLCGAFGGLSETHHQILVLRELEGLSYREIGERLSLSRPAVESTLFRARRRLTEEYDELVSGRRCERVQAIITAAAEGMLGARDRRKLARHTAICQVCRRHARRLGIEDLEAPTTLRAKLAALLPIPVFLRRGSDGASIAGGHGSGVAAQVSSLGAMADPVAATWTKAVAAVAALAFAGAGAHVAAQHGHPLPGVGHLPIIGSHEAGKVAPARVRAVTVDDQRLLPAKDASSKGVAPPGSSTPTSRTASRPAGPSRSGPTDPSRSGAPAASRDPGSGGGSSGSGASLPSASTPSAPQQPRVDLPSIQPSSAAPSTSGGGGSGSGVSLPDTSSIGSSAPSVPSTPSAPVDDVTSVVSSVTGS